MKKELNIPIQVQSLINNLLNPNEDHFIRANYRGRLEDVQAAITNAILKYEKEISPIFDADKTRKEQLKRYGKVKAL
jgi:hypothetical protein